MSSIGAFPQYIFSGYSRPFVDLLHYHLLGLGLCVAILLALVALEALYARYSLATRLFTRMFEMRRRHLYSFGVDVTATPEARLICHASKWVVRVALVSVMCYLWQSLILFEMTLLPDTEAAKADATRALCRMGLFCVDHATSEGMFFKFLRSERNSLCAQDIGEGGPELPERPYLTCTGIWKSDALSIAINCGIAYALFQLVISLYQVVAWMIFKSRGRALQLGVLIVSVALAVLWLVLVLAENRVFSHTWFAAIGYFSLPVILICGRAAGLQTQTRHRLQFKEAVDSLPRLLQETSMGARLNLTRTDGFNRPVFHEDVSTALGLSAAAAGRGGASPHRKGRQGPGAPHAAAAAKPVAGFRKSISDIAGTGGGARRNDSPSSRNEPKKIV